MTASTERPIIFGAPSIRAILDGRKSQTRRVLSTRNTRRDGYPWSKRYPWGAHDWANAFVDDGPSPAGNPGPYLKAPYPAQETRHRIYPIYWPGDRFWVRETWWIAERYSYGTTPGGVELSPPPLAYRAGSPVHYAADGDPPNVANRTYGPDGLQNGAFAAPDPYAIWMKISPIHMPRWASRITLEVTDVRIERLHDISEDDAIAEGIEPFGDGVAFVQLDDAQTYGTLRTCFQTLWDDIHGPDAWEANPWVAAITFKRLKAGSR